MRTKSFFASAAKAAFALAAVVMMSAVFTSCSKDDDDDDAKKFTNTVILDGTEKSIVSAEYDDKGKGNYFLYLYLSSDRQERVIINLNKDLHMTGKPVDLTKKEAEHAGFNWVIDYYDADGTTLIYTFGKPDSAFPVFKTGTLTMSGSPTGTINIKLENGRVKGTDGNEHTLVVSYSGPMTKA